MIMFGSFVCVATTLYLYYNKSAVVSAYALSDMVIILLFSNVLIRLGFCMRWLFGAVHDGSGLFLYLDRWLTFPQRIESISVLLACVVLTLIANFHMGREERLNFLLRLRSERQSEDLREGQYGVAEAFEQGWVDGLLKPALLRHAVSGGVGAGGEEWLGAFGGYA